MLKTEPMRTVLPNGLVVIAQRVAGAPLVSFQGFVKGGAILDCGEKSGRSNLMMQVLRRGTKTKTVQEIDDALERRGAELNLGAGLEGLSIHLSCLPDDLPDCLDLLADILQNPTFPEEEVQKQKVRIVNALREELTRPEEVSNRLFFELAYPPEHPFHYPSSGTPESVAELTREDLVQAYQTALHPADAVFCIVGDKETEALTDTVVSFFARWETDGSLAFEPPSALLPEQTKQERVTLPDKTQCWIAMGHKCIRRSDERFYAANVLTTVLGTAWGRLFTEIRDNQGLAYAVFAGLQAGLGEGPFVVRMGVNPKDLERAIESAIRELEKVRREPPKDDEVSDAKNYSLGRLVLSMETTDGVASMLLNCELYGLGLDYPQRAKSFYEPITPQQVRETAEALIHPDRMVIAIAGP